MSPPSDLSLARDQSSEFGLVLFVPVSARIRGLTIFRPCAIDLAARGYAAPEVAARAAWEVKFNKTSTEHPRMRSRLRSSFRIKLNGGGFVSTATLAAGVVLVPARPAQTPATPWDLPGKDFM